MQLVPKLIYRTHRGLAVIAQDSVKGHYHAIFDGESLGRYETIQQAVSELSGGHTFWPSTGIDPSTLGIPDDVGDWDRVGKAAM